MLSTETSGRFQPNPDDVWAFDGEPAKTPQDTWWWWLVTALVLLPIDIAARRVQ